MQIEGHNVSLILHTEYYHTISHNSHILSHMYVRMIHVQLTWCTIVSPLSGSHTHVFPSSDAHTPRPPLPDMSIHVNCSIYKEREIELPAGSSGICTCIYIYIYIHNMYLLLVQMNSLIWFDECCSTVTVFCMVTLHC